MEVLHCNERPLLEKKQEFRDIEYESLLKEDALADVIMYGVPTKEGRIRQMDALVAMERKIPTRVERSHVMLVSANVLTMAVMASQLSMHRWRVTEAQTLQEATALLQEQVTRAEKTGQVVRRNVSPASNVNASSKTISGHARPAQRAAEGRSAATAEKENEKEPAAAAAAAAAAEACTEKQPVSRCSSVCSAECEEEQQKPVANDTIAHLVVIDAFTHDPFDVTLEHLRYFDREHGLNLVIVLMLYDSYNGHAPGVAVLPNHSITIDEAYAMGFDLVIRRIFDHKVVNVFSDMFMSATGRWRNDVRRRGAVGNYRAMQDLLFGGENIKTNINDDDSQLTLTRASSPFDLGGWKQLSLSHNAERGKAEMNSKLSYSANADELSNGTLNGRFGLQMGKRDGKSHITACTIARDATGNLMQPASTVKHAVRKRLGEDNQNGENDEESYEEVLIDEMEEVESAQIAEYRREIARLVEEVEQSRCNLALLQQEQSYRTESRDESDSEQQSLRVGYSAPAISQTGEDDLFGYNAIGDTPVTLTKEQQIYMLKRRLTEIKDQLEGFTDAQFRRPSKFERRKSSLKSGSLARLPSSALKTQAPSKRNSLIITEAIEHVAEESESESGCDSVPHDKQMTNRRRKKGKVASVLDHNKAEQDIITSLVGEVVALKDQLARTENGKLGKASRHSPGNVEHKGSDESTEETIDERRQSNAMELVKIQRSHIEFLEERLAEYVNKSKSGKKSKKKVEVGVKGKRGNRARRGQIVGHSPGSKKNATMQEKQLQREQIGAQGALLSDGDGSEATVRRRGGKGHLTEPSEEPFSAAISKQNAANYMYEARFMKLRDQAQGEKVDVTGEGRAKVVIPTGVTRVEDASLSVEIHSEARRAYMQSRSPSVTEQYLKLTAEHAQALKRVEGSLHNLRSFFENNSLETSDRRSSTINNSSNNSSGVEKSLQSQMWSAVREYAINQQAADEIANRLLTMESASPYTEERSPKLGKGGRRGSRVYGTHRFSTPRETGNDASTAVLDKVRTDTGLASAATQTSQRSSESIVKGDFDQDMRRLSKGRNSHVNVLDDLYIEHHKILLRLLRLMGKENSAIAHETADHESLILRDGNNITTGYLIPADTALLFRLVNLIERRNSVLRERDERHAEEVHQTDGHRHYDSETDNRRHEFRDHSTGKRHKRRSWDDVMNAYPDDTKVTLSMPENIAQLMSRADIRQDGDMPRSLREMLENIAAEDAAANARPSSALVSNVRRELARLADARQKARDATVMNERRRIRESVKRRARERNAVSFPTTAANRSSSRSSCDNQRTTEAYSTQSYSGESSGSEMPSETISAQVMRRVFPSSRYGCNVSPESHRALLRRLRGEDQILIAAKFRGDVGTEVSQRGMDVGDGELFPPKSASGDASRARRACALPPLLSRGLTHAQQKQFVFTQLSAEGISPRDLSHVQAYTRVAEHPMAGASFQPAELAERIMAYRATLAKPNGLSSSVAAHAQPSFFIPVIANTNTNTNTNAHAGEGESGVAAAVLSAEYTSWVYGVPAERLAPMVRGAAPESADTMLFLPGSAGAAEPRGGAPATFVGRMIARLQALGTPATKAAERLNARLQESMAETHAWPLAVIGHSVARPTAQQQQQQTHRRDQRPGKQEEQRQHGRREVKPKQEEEDNV